VKISIITVVFNNPEVSRALDSILAQKLEEGDELELIVVDGGSRDGTLDVLGRYREKLAALVTEPDEGIYDAMNKGLRLATGEVIGTLNSDDVYAGVHAVASLARRLKETRADLVYADVVYVSRNDPARVVRHFRSGPLVAGGFAKGWMPAHPTVFVRRSVYQKYGLFDPSLKFAADFELMMRFLAGGEVSWSYLPEVMVRMQAGGASNASLLNILKSNLESYRACRMNRVEVTPWFFVHKLGSRLPQFFRPRQAFAN
jgi:glycosyltransferase involved in cell wall biosynthesis